jgi:lysophospholipase L1-like esterase
VSRLRGAFLVVVAVLAGCASPASPTPPSVEPVTLAALGDSLMAGYNADPQHAGVFSEVSWPTGEGNWSFASRLGASKSENWARPQEKLSALPRQAAKMHRGAFALVGFGANDLCPGGGTETTDTTILPVPVAEFEAALRADIRALEANGSRVLVVSIPDIPSMHAVAPAPAPEDSFVYTYFGAGCGRTNDQFRADIQAYNAAILRATQSENALSDAGAIWRLKWSREMVSSVDGVHPSLVGAHAMAAAVWDAYASQVPSAGR